MAQIIKIDDINAPELSVYASLTEAQLKKECDLFIAESVKVIDVALDCGLRPISFLMEERQIDGIGKEIISRCPDVPVYTASREVLSSLTGFELTRGVLCAMRRPEIVFQPIEETEKGAISSKSFILNLKGILKSSAILVGIGMTECFDTEATVTALISNYEGRLIIDADGLNSIKTCPEKLISAKKTPIITPHVGEMARLTKLSISEIKESRERVALDFAKKYNCVVVLKDSVTVIASPEGRSITLDRENSALAKGGSGDVLSGIIASLSAQGLAPYDAALCGAVIHSEAGLAASSVMAEESVLPSDIIACLSAVFKELRS